MTVSSMPASAQPTAAMVGAPAAQRRTWVRRITGGGRIVETCPEWCTSDHRMDASGALDDLTHHGDEVAVEIPVVHHWTDGEPVTIKMLALSVQIRQDPYSENPRRSRPFAVVELADDHMADELEPDQLAAIITLLRVHLGRMEQVHAQLVQALSEHPGTPAVA